MWVKSGNFEDNVNYRAGFNRRVTYTNNEENTKVVKFTLVGHEDNSLLLFFTAVDENSFAELERASREVGFSRQNTVSRDMNNLRFSINAESIEHVALLFQTLTQIEPSLAEIQDEIADVLGLDSSIERQAIERPMPIDNAQPSFTLRNTGASQRFFAPLSVDFHSLNIISIDLDSLRSVINRLDNDSFQRLTLLAREGLHPRNYGNTNPRGELQDVLNRSFSEISNRTEQQMPKPGLNSELLEEINFDESAIPPEYLCPLSGTIMTTPVFDPKYPNYIFEKSWIITALQIKSKNPFNRQPMQAGDLVLHETLRDEISAYVQGLKDNRPTHSPGN